MSTNFAQFLTILRHSSGLHSQNPLSKDFIASIIDRFIQNPPPNFTERAQADLETAIHLRYSANGELPPTEVLAALCLRNLALGHNELVTLIHRIGDTFTSDEESCTKALRNAGNIRLDEEMVGGALLYTAISRTPKHSASIFVSALKRVLPRTFKWEKVITAFDKPHLRVTSQQFLSIFQALRPLAESSGDEQIDLQRLWGGRWQQSETQLSFLTAYSSLDPTTELNASDVPGLHKSFSLDMYSGASEAILARAETANTHPLSSSACIQAIYYVALASSPASDTTEAKRLFQTVIVPNLDIFVVSAFGAVPKPWSEVALETTSTLFDRFLSKSDRYFDFVLYSVWISDKSFVRTRLEDAHSRQPLELGVMLEIALEYAWLTDLILSKPCGFSMDLAALAHASHNLDINEIKILNDKYPQLFPRTLMTFLTIKADHELQHREFGVLVSITLPVRTVSALLNIMTDVLPTAPLQDSMLVQRKCITAYPRLINYGQGYDEIIDENGREQNSLPQEANVKMEQHYRRMYSEEESVRDVLEALQGYKRSHNPMDQEVFACMIHGLFDEYSLYSTYPLEALKTTALLFGGIIRYKLISDLPLEIALGMIIDAVRDNSQEDPMYKFGLQALTQTVDQFESWPGLCRQLVQIPQLAGTEAFSRAEQVVSKADADAARMTNGVNGDGNTREETVAATKPPFTSISADPPPQNVFEEPSEETQEKILFVLNNVTDDNLDSKFSELRIAVDDKHHTWFAGHLVESRAKMQPNYHQLYLHLVQQFNNRGLWAEILRETYVSTVRMLNAESTLTMASERALLRNLGEWLGLLTLARDQPIKYRNIAFKQLLHEGFHSQRLVVVLPFVCKVLAKAKGSDIFTANNPWILDILRCLAELYQTDLKLNLKFEIEVLCNTLGVTLGSIEPWSELQTLQPAIEASNEQLALDVVERFDNLSVNGMGVGAASGRFSPQNITAGLPDFANELQYPPVNDMIDQAQVRDIVRTAITRAVYEIISPVVERSVTIAAISTTQMINKDFATEPDENRLRSAAISMVKRTAGALALVTSKEPLRASMTNYIRAMSQTLPQGLPEGTIIISVNANLDAACNVVERRAEERAVPEIEEMIEPQLEVRRQHRLRGGREPFVDHNLVSRWAMTIPAPYKLMPNANGLNHEQMAIYDEFARQPRIAAPNLASHGASSSDATRSMANDILQDGYGNSSQMTSGADASSAQPLPSTQQPYSQVPTPLTNGRAQPVDMNLLANKITELLDQIVIVASNTTEQHMEDLPRTIDGHPVVSLIDQLLAILLRSTQLGNAGLDALKFAIEEACQRLFNQAEDSLAIEALAHVMWEASKVSTPLARLLMIVIENQPDERLLSVPLVMTLLRMEFLDWHRVDLAVAKSLQQRSESTLDFFSTLIHKVLLNDRAIALRTDFARSLEVLGQWAHEDGNDAGPANQLVQSLSANGIPQSIDRDSNGRLEAHKDQVEYIFDEWRHLCQNPNTSDTAFAAFIDQLHNKQIMNDVDNTCLFFRICIDKAVEIAEVVMEDGAMPTSEAQYPVDALAKLMAWLIKEQGKRSEEVKLSAASHLKSILSFMVLVLNHHYVMRGEHFNHRVFYRLFSSLLCEIRSVVEQDSVLYNAGEIYGSFADIFVMLAPDKFHGFIFSWISLICHRDFLPMFLDSRAVDEWDPIVRILEILLRYVGEMSKQVHPIPILRGIYESTVKIFLSISQDWPQLLAANHTRLCQALSANSSQLKNLILTANPNSSPGLPDPLQQGIKIDRWEEVRRSPIIGDRQRLQAPMQEAGLLDLIDQALKSGPSEDAVAHIAHAIHRKNGHQTTLGFVPVNVDIKLIDSIVLHICITSIEKAQAKQSATFVSASPDAALLNMLVHELNPEAKYYFLDSIVNQLRYPSSHTHYFSQALLEIFGSDMNDPEDLDIRQVVVRILFERSIGQWPQPWGLILVLAELIKNEKYNFFELPFIKADREVSFYLTSVLSRAEKAT